MDSNVTYVPKRKPPRKKPVSRETGLQVACVNWFRMQYRPYERLLFAIPNGGLRSKATAGKLKAEGALAGVPDLMLALPRSRFHGLFIEMKVIYPDGKKNYASPEQRQQMNAFWAQGYEVATCYTLDQFIQTINDYLFP